jgi:hypothetical protein
VSFRHIAASLVLLVAVVYPSASPLTAQQPKATPKSDLDAFMERALARREANKRVLNDYILDESEEFEILGPTRMRIYRHKRDYTWFVRETIHVRSPLKIDGVSVPEEERVRYEERWLHREKARRERKAKNEKEQREITIGTDGVQANVLPNGPASMEPRFVSEAYFMDFKFEPGNYFLAGREKFEGQDVLKIEYYPTKLFGGKDDEKSRPEMKADEQSQAKETKQQQREREKEKQLEQDIERKMNKTALVTLWVDPSNHQIVKYTFDNVWLDFLPAGWLVQVDEMRASMTMYQPFKDVWLPREIKIGAGITLALGSFEAAYDRSFRDYREADVKSKITIPKKSPEPEIESSEAFQLESGSRAEALAETDLSAETLADAPVSAEPFTEAGLPTGALAQVGTQATAPQQEIVREIRVHGNAAIADAEVLKIAGITVDAPLAGDAVAAIEKRLKDSGWFETVQVRKRYRSIDDPTDVAIVLVVHERPSVRVSQTTGAPTKDPFHVFKRRTMFLPILSYADGYGFTYGVRFSWSDLLGLGERISTPLTWGGTRRAGVEVERTFKSGPLTRVFTSASIYQRENPAFQLEPDDDGTDDRRMELRGRAERHFAHLLFTGVEATRAQVEFGPNPEVQQWTLGADAAIDTRGDPSFPGNAVYLFAGWNELHVPDTDRINRYTLDGRGYLRLFRQPVLAGRVLYQKADAPLPLHERYLIGGSSTLRGFGTGDFNGDKTLAASAELRIPITSVISGAKLGLNVFTDAAKTAEFNGRLKDRQWEQSAGAGVFLIASVIKLNLDVAKAFDGGTRVHFSSGFSF